MKVGDLVSLIREKFRLQVVGIILVEDHESYEESCFNILWSSPLDLTRLGGLKTWEYESALELVNESR